MAKSFGKDRNVHAKYVCPTEDSCFLVVGCIDNTSIGNRLMYVVKINEDGNLVWEKIFGSGWMNEALCNTKPMKINI